MHDIYGGQWHITSHAYVKRIYEKRNIHYIYSGGSRNFKTGGAVPAREKVCFDAPSHIPYLFVARVVNKINNVNIVYWLKSEFMRVKISVKIYQKPP